jgi:hypothetical protein
VEKRKRNHRIERCAHKAQLYFALPRPTHSIGQWYIFDGSENLDTIWEGDPGHLEHFGLLVAVTSTSLKVYGAHDVGAHPRNSLSLVGAILDIYLLLSEFISDGLPKRGID